MESNSAQAAREQLASLASSRELALERLLPSWRYVIASAVFMNGCMLAVVLPIYLSEGWDILVRAVFLAATFAILLPQKRRQAVKRPRLRVQHEWVPTAVSTVGFGSALAVGIYASLNDNPWLGAVALIVNFASYLVVYGGWTFLVRRQFARLP